jgi:hypothetical protein
MNDSRLIELAIQGLESVRKQIDAEIAELRNRIGGAIEQVAEVILPPKNGRRARKGSKGRKGRKGLTPEGRKALSEAMKRRWAAKRRAAR